MEVVTVFNTAFSACATWFVNLLNATNLGGLFIAMFFIHLVGRFILSPILGAATGQLGSDVVKSNRSKSGSSSSRSKKG